MLQNKTETKRFASPELLCSNTRRSKLQAHPVISSNGSPALRITIRYQTPISSTLNPDQLHFYTRLSSLDSQSAPVTALA
jgi:hypothetical protein